MGHVGRHVQCSGQQALSIAPPSSVQRGKGTCPMNFVPAKSLSHSSISSGSPSSSASRGNSSLRTLFVRQQAVRGMLKVCPCSGWGSSGAQAALWTSASHLCCHMG